MVNKKRSMKKYIVLVVVAIMTSVSMNAQEKGDFNYKVRLGAALSTFTNNDDAKMEPNFQYAIGLDYILTDRFAVSLEAQANYLGAKSKLHDKRMTLFYTSIPLLAKYYVTPWLAVQAGPQVSFLRRATIDGEKTFEGVRVKDMLKKVELAIPLGLSFEPKIGKNGDALLVDLRYHLGLTPVNKKSDGDSKSNYNSAIVLTVGYRTDFFR